MTSAEQQTAAESILMRLPAGWRVVAVDVLLGDEIPEMLVRALGDVSEIAAMRSRLSDLGTTLARQGLCFMALRVEEEACDVVTLALPGPGNGDGPEPATESGTEPTTQSDTEPTTESGTELRLGGTSAVVHDGGPQDAAGPGPWVTSEQIVFVVPGTQRGAVLTAISTDARRAERVSRDAREMVASVRLKSTGGDAD